MAEPDEWKPITDLSIMDILPSTRQELRHMGDDDAFLIVNLMQIHYANHHQDDENFWMLPVTLYCVLYGLIEYGNNDEKKEIMGFYKCIIRAYEKAKNHGESFNFTENIDTVLTEQRKMLKEPLTQTEKTKQEEKMGRLRKVTATFYMAVRKNNLGIIGSPWANCVPKATKILTLFTEKADGMLLRAAYNICEDHLRFLKKDNDIDVFDFVESYVVVVMVKLEVLLDHAKKKPLRFTKTTSKTGKPQKGVMDEIEEDTAYKHPIFKLIKQLTEENCYSWEQYELIKSAMKNIEYDKQYHCMLADMDVELRYNITSLESKIKPWIEELQSVHISSVVKSLENFLSHCSEVTRQIMGGDLRAIPVNIKKPCMPFTQEMDRLLNSNDLKNMQEEDLKKRFRNALNTLPTGDLKLLLEGVLKNLVTFSASTKTTLELQIKCKLCLFFKREPEVLTDVQEGSEELMILFSFCLMEKTKEKRKNGGKKNSDYYLHYVTSDPKAICEKYQSCIDKLFKRSPPYCTLLSDLKHGGIMLKICRDKDYATLRRIDSNLHVLLLDTSFFDDRDLETCLWNIWRKKYENTNAHILSHLEKELPCLYDRQGDLQKWVRDTVRPLYDSIAGSGSKPISEVKKYIDKYGIKLGAASRFHESATDFLSNPTNIENKMEYSAIFAQNDEEFKMLLEAGINAVEEVKVAVIFPDKETSNEDEKKHFEAIEESMQSERVTFYYGFSKASTNLPNYCHVIQTYPLERTTLRKSSLGSFNFLINITRLKNVVSKDCMINFIGSSKYYAAEWNNTLLWKMQIDVLLLSEFPQGQVITNNNALASNSANAQVPTADESFTQFYGFLTNKHAFMIKHVLPFNQSFTFENVKGVLKKVVEIRAKRKFVRGERNEGIIIATQADLLKSWYNALKTDKPVHLLNRKKDVVFIHCSHFEMIIDTREQGNEEFIKRARVLEAVIEVYLDSLMLHHFARVVSVTKVVNIGIGDTVVQNSLEDVIRKNMKPVKIEFEPPNCPVFPQAFALFASMPCKKGVNNTLKSTVERCVSLIKNSLFERKDFIAEIVEGSSTSFYKISGSENIWRRMLQSMLGDEKNRTIAVLFEDGNDNDAYCQKLSSKPLGLIPIANIHCGYIRRNVLKKDYGPKFQIWNGLENLKNLSYNSASKNLIVENYKKLMNLGVEDEQKAKICGGYEALFNMDMSSEQTTAICGVYDELQNLVKARATGQPDDEYDTKYYFAVEKEQWIVDGGHYTAMSNALYNLYYSREHSLAPPVEPPHEIVAKVYAQSTRMRSSSQ